MNKLSGFKTRKESLLPTMDVYLNKYQEIWVYNVDLTKNTDYNNWVQLMVKCEKCGWSGAERIIGDGMKSHVIVKDGKKLISEMYFARCPYCKNAWEIDTTRPYDPKTLAMSIDDDLNTSISEVDEELEENKNEI